MVAPLARPLVVRAVAQVAVVIVEGVVLSPGLQVASLQRSVGSELIRGRLAPVLIGDVEELEARSTPRRLQRVGSLTAFQG